MKALIITEKLGTDDSRCSTFIANEAVARGHEVYECYSDKISLLNGEIICEASHYCHPHDEVMGIHRENLDGFPPSGENDRVYKKFVIKRDFDVVFFRPNPPVDMAYLTTLYLLQLIENDVLILNKPSSVIRFPEKILPHYFADFSPPTLISKNRAEIVNFVKTHNGAVAKPLYWYGGNGVKKISNEAEIDELLAQNKEPLVYQKFLPEVAEGDKRFIFVNSKFIGLVNRVPPAGEFIANLCHGGEARAFEPNEYQKTQIIPRVEKFLLENEISFCGIDVIGNYVNEMNITSPVAFAPMKEVYGTNEEKRLWDELEHRLSN